MSERFEYRSFQECNLEDSFFDSLKTDYPEFPTWFQKKQEQNAFAYIYQEKNHILAFEYLKEECEEITLQDNKILESCSRLKIGTLKIENDVRGRRLGEGLLGIALWNWQQSTVNQIYLTVFDKHETLISILSRFGFERIGLNLRGEAIFLKDKTKLNYDDPYKLFPYITRNFHHAKYLPIKDRYHDTLFPYSGLQRTSQNTLNLAVANGVTKVFIGFPSDVDNLNYEENQPIAIYRISSAMQRKTYLSVVSSFGIITDYSIAKREWKCLLSEEEYLRCIGNKSFFSVDELKVFYQNQKNIVIIKLLYNGYFGAGNNVNHKWLKEHGHFEGHPYQLLLGPEEFREIIREGGKNEQNIILD